MSFQKNLLDALAANASLKESIRSLASPPVSAKITESLAYIQAYGNICMSHPYFYELSKLDSFCLIYTQGGAGLLKINSRSYTMKHGTIAFVDCNQWHRVEAEQTPWIYKVFFISGPPVAFFYNSLVEESGNLHSFLPGSSIPYKIEKLYCFLADSADKPLIHSKCISDILYELLLERSRLHDTNPDTCNCIYEIKHDFDCKYMDSITLEFLEQKYHMSRYHICREFIKRFHISPIKYLNYRKIEAAKEALLNTDKKIVEIGRMVGFENPNSFIRNFKKCTGVTPLEYRKHFLANKI